MITDKQVDEFCSKFLVMERKMILTDEQVEKMVNQFLSWKLPEHFYPDAGISFKPTNDIPYEGDKYGNSWWPIGTNLFTAPQAREMILHMLKGIK